MGVIDCPKCGKAVSEEFGKCPYCGEEFNGGQKEKMETSKQEPGIKSKIDKKHKNIYIVCGVAFIVIICSAFFMKYSSKNVYDYTTYVGKFYKDLPSEFKTEKMNDVFCSAELDKIVKFKGNKGTISFMYSVDERMEDLGIQTNALDKLLWKADANSEQQCNKIKKALEKEYGEYTDFKVYKNDELNNDETGDGETIIYTWNNKEGMNIDLNYETNDLDEIVEIFVIWSRYNPDAPEI